MMNATAAHPSNSIRVWDLPLRLFHWALVGAIAVAFLSSEEESVLANWHMASGWIAAVLIAFRLVWGLVGGEHARFVNFIRPSGILPHLRDLASGRVKPSLGHNPAGAAAVLAMLAAIVVVVVSGLQTLGGGEEDLHEAIAYALLGLVAVHVAAVIAMSLMTRENLVRAMVTGRKPSALHPDARDARRPGMIGLVIALGVSAAAVAGVRTIDPAAFSLQPREAAEGGESEEEGHARSAEAAGHAEGARADDDDEDEHGRD